MAATHVKQMRIICNAMVCDEIPCNVDGSEKKEERG
jgi:hypothetical protein